MLYCEDCSYLKNLQNNEELELCRKYLCEYSNSVLFQENIFNSTEYPCCQEK